MVVTEYLSPYSGKLGQNSTDEYYESNKDTRGIQRTTRNIESETGFNVYHGKIVQYDHHKQIKVTAYSLIDLVI